jgi:hypothetical protein
MYALLMPLTHSVLLGRLVSLDFMWPDLKQCTGICIGDWVRPRKLCHCTQSRDCGLTRDLPSTKQSLTTFSIVYISWGYEINALCYWTVNSSVQILDSNQATRARKTHSAWGKEAALCLCFSTAEGDDIVSSLYSIFLVALHLLSSIFPVFPPQGVMSVWRGEERLEILEGGIFLAGFL